MNENSIIQYITETFTGVDVAKASGDSFFIYDPNHDLDDNRRFPFATLVTADNYDTASNLNRLSVFRLNIGVSKATFRALFELEQEYDPTALDQIMPHPVYSKMHWVSVLNPSDATFETVKSLLTEAYEISVKRLTKGY